MTSPETRAFVDDDDDYDSEYTLADLIPQKFETCVFPPREKAHKFLPESCVKELINEEAVVDQLSKLKSDKDLLNFICNHAKKVFAIALNSGLRNKDLFKTMDFFRHYQFKDESLPILQLDGRKTAPEPFCEFPKLWTLSRRDSFYESQWKFLAPVFSNDKFIYKLESDHILPFTWVNNTVREGAFSKVFEVKIHKSHQEDLPPGNFAIKEVHESQQDAEKNWEAEAKALHEITGLKHDHIIQRIAAITKGEKRYFMFSWADGGSLRDYWQSMLRPTLTPQLVEETLEQLKGLAAALHELHYFKGQGAYRHGDLKPENILRFKDVSPHKLGTLKIADMGLAKYHGVLTVYRKSPTSTKAGTVRYEPPETKTTQTKATSRLYDIWSMGCIVLEYIVWLLYGYEEVERLNATVQQDEGFYFKILEEGGQKTAIVHPDVTRWMSHMSEDPECTAPSALKDLLDLVASKLLVVALNPRRERTFQIGTGEDSGELDLPVRVSGPEESTPFIPGGPYRADTGTFCKSLENILKKGSQNESYLFTGKLRDSSKGPTIKVSKPTPKFLSPGATQPIAVRQNPAGREPYQGGLGGGLAPPQRQNVDYSHPPLNKIWRFPVDNQFTNFLADQLRESTMPLISEAPKLCSRCQDLDFWTPGFVIHDKKSDLEERSKNCDFCRMLWRTCKRLDKTQATNVRFDRVESTLGINGGNVPALSIRASPESKSPMPMQVGFPVLPTAGSPMHFDILRSWLMDCDKEHNCRPKDPVELPTRLIDVGTMEDPTIHLHEKAPGETGRYLALSHPWGDPEKHPHFCTYVTNIAKYKKKIDFERLPATFKDAIVTTRELGFRYLWIDSICIIQGPEGDFNVEAKRMEDVFSSAFCVIAASSSTGQCDGFLKPRQPRTYLALRRPNKEPFYVCDHIDDFNEDVLEGRLCKRAWVLQERALSHRTIYFTDGQTYWECGEGVRCETLTKMYNGLAAFLGDPNFPKVAMESSRGGKIRLYQDLYMQYSRLAFSRIEDRPIAVAGLEKRLIKDFKTRGGFGVFDDGRGLLNRSLLWQRGSDENTLARIVFPIDREVFVPTWSWMSYKGGIDYLEPPFQKVEWVKINSPWLSDDNRERLAGSEASHTTDRSDNISLTAVVHDFELVANNDKESKIIHDIPGKTEGQILKCVVLGRQNDGISAQERRHYVLVVTPCRQSRSKVNKTYERVGVGFLPGRLIKLDPTDPFVKIL